MDNFNLGGDLPPTILTILTISIFLSAIFTHNFDFSDIEDNSLNRPHNFERYSLNDSFLPQFEENTLVLTLAIIYILSHKQVNLSSTVILFPFLLLVVLPSTLAENVISRNFTTSCADFATVIEKYEHGCLLTSFEESHMLAHFSQLAHYERYVTSLPHCEFLNLTMREQDIDCTFTPEEDIAARGFFFYFVFYGIQFVISAFFGASVVIIYKMIRAHRANQAQQDALLQGREQLAILLEALDRNDDELEPQAGSSAIDLQPYEQYISLAVHSLGFFNDLKRFTSTSVKKRIINVVFSSIRYILNFCTLTEAATKLSVIFGGQLKPKHFLEVQSGLPREFLNNWSSLSNGELATKTKHVLIGLVSCPLVKHFGLEFDISNLKNFISLKKTDLNFTSGPEMARSVLDLVVTFAETGHECFASKSLQPILIQNRFVRKWLREFHELSVELAEKPINMDFSAVEALAKIDNLISRGSQLLHTNPIEVRPCWRVLMEKRVRLLQEHNVAAPRKPPFSFLVYGSPGIGKSTIMQNVGTLYHRVVSSNDIYPDLTWDPAVNMYNRNGKDNFWSGYKGAQHYYVIIDDMGREHPNHVAAGKATSLDDVIDIVNTIPVGSNQAGVEDKGAIPIVPKIFGASTNTKGLNANLAVAEASAILRRMPIVIEPVLKPQFMDNETGMMKKLSEVVQDAWDYKVEEVKLEKVLNNIRVRYDLIAGSGPDGLMTGAEFSQYMTKKIIEHEKSSQVMMDGNKVSDEVTLCEHNVLSYYPCPECEPLEIQAWYHKIPVFRKPSFKERVTRRLAHFAVDYFPISVYTRYIERNTEFFTTVYCERLDLGLSPTTVLARNLALTLISSGFVYFALTYLIQFLSVPSDEEEEEEISVQADEEKLNIWALLSPSANEKFSLPIVHKTNNLQEIENSIIKGSFRLAIQNGDVASEVTAFCLRHGWYVTVSHPFLTGEEWKCVAVYPTQHVSKLTPQRGFILEKQFIKYIGNDLIVFCNSSLLPRKELYNFLPKHVDKRGRNFKIFDQRYPIMGHGSSTSYTSLSYKNTDGTPIVGEFMEAYRKDRPPMRGDCGGIILSEAGGGYYISGIHCAGSPGGLGFRMILSQVAQELFQFDAPLLAMSGFSDMRFIEAGSGSSGPLRPPHPTKGVHHWASGNAMVLGSYSRRVTSRSRTKRSLICDSIEKEFDIVNPFVAPLMSAELVDDEWHNPFTIATQSQANLSPHFKDSTLIKCADAFVEELLSDPSWLDDAGPVDLRTAINGVNGDTYMNRIPMSTSGGFYFPGAKHKYFDEVIEDGFPVAYAKKEILDMVDAIEENYALGNRACVLFNGTLKDEPIKQSKRDSGKTRVFTASDVAFSLVVRKKFLGLTKAIMTHNFISECMVGMNPYSLDWQRLHTFLTAFGSSFVFDGDFRDFDKGMAANLMRTGFYVFECLLKFVGISHRDLMIVRGIATDICFPIVNMNGDVIQFFGGNPSGHSLTVILNSAVNSIYMRHAYNDVADVSTFKLRVHLATLGDDNVGNSKMDEFNHTQISEHLRRHGVEYTMADKTSESIPFHHISTVDFLKRGFTDLDGRIVGPLALNSIFKSLMMYVEKGNISHEEQLSQSYLAARREWSLHGKAVFDEYTGKMEKIFSEHPDVTRFHLPQHAMSYEDTIAWVQEN